MKRPAVTPQPDAKLRRSSPSLLATRLLGKFQVQRGDELIPDAAWSRRSVSTLFTYVLLSPNHRCHKEQALDLLWPDLDPAAAANNLHKTLFYLRRTLYPEANDARDCPYVEYDGETITLDLIGSVDAEAFERQAKDAQAAHDPARYAAAIDLYAGDLLPDGLYADWMSARREALRQIYMKLLRRFGELQLAARDCASAIVAFDRLLATDPADEAAHSALMKAYALSGQRHQALRQYHTCCQALATELDAGPMPETVALYQAILKGEVAPELTLASTLSMSLPSHPLIGRATEVATLMSALEAVHDGSPRLALIAGEAGVGKTRLAHEVARLAHERGMPVLIGSTYEPVGALHEPPLPYGPFVEALRRFFSDQPIETRQQLIGPWQSDLAHLLPELSDESSTSTIEPEAAKRRLFDAVAHALIAIGTTHPVLLLLDDLHAADQATFDLLGYLLHRSPPVRVCVLALAREEGIDTRHYAPLTDLLARVGRRGSLVRLSLARLDQAEMAQFVRDRLSGQVEYALPRTIYEASEGNPLFAEQLLQAWREAGTIGLKADRWQLRSPHQSLTLPGSVRETIGLRLARLSADAQDMLALAAVIGREIPYEWLQAAGSWHERTLLDLLDEAWQAHVLDEASQRTGPVLYRFHHGLIRQTLYENLSEARRRHLHQRVAEALEARPDVPFSTLSHHWFAVGRWTWAFCHALTAADLARRAFAHVEAVSLYDRALATTHLEWQPDHDLLGRVHTGRAQALMGLNRPIEAVTDLQWLADRARASGQRALYGQAISQLAAAHFWGHNLDTARQLAHEALSIAEETGDNLTATMCTSNLGCIALSTGRLEEGTGYLERVLQQVRTFGQPASLVEALACLPGGYHWQGQSARSLSLLEEGIAVAQREGLGFWLGNLLFFAGLAHGSLGHYEPALDYFRRGQRHSQESGDMFTAIRVANSLGWIHHELCDLSSAIAFDRQGVEMARGFPWPEPMANALVNLGLDHLSLNDLDQAEHAFNEATTLLVYDEWMRWRWQTRLLLGQGWLALARRAVDQAETFAHQALTLAQETTACKNQARAQLLWGEIALARRDAARSIPVLQRATELAQAVENPRLIWQSLAALARAHMACGEDRAALESWSRASQVIRSIAANLNDETLRNAFTHAEAVQGVLRQISVPSS